MPSLRALRHPRLWSYHRARRLISKRHIAGTGIEVGALHSPFPVASDIRVRYVDRMTTQQLRVEYPELGDVPLVPVDFVDDGEHLSSLASGSQDFVIASHFLEHCEDPIGTLEAQLRVLRPGGVLLLALPDRRSGIDQRRQPTSLAHLVADHERGPETSRSAHYEEWARDVDLPLGNTTSDELEAHAAQLERRRYSIHFHCWTAEEFAAQLERLLPTLTPRVAIVEQRTNNHEFLVALKRL